MATNITARLSSLRKEKGLSQKEAAAGLGVSQALLSHYENGIRECGLDFLCRAADYYNVTADYLLGLSESKRGFEGAFGIKGDLPSDSELNTLTIFRVAGKLRNFLSFPQEGSSAVDALHRIYSLMMYRIIIAETAKSCLPNDWVPNIEKLNEPSYLCILDCIENGLITQGSLSPRRTPAKIPLCFKTVIDRTQSFVASTCEENGISLDARYITKL